MGKALLSAENYVQVPLLYVKIGNYTFGKYEKDNRGWQKYPNYIDSLTVTKINGTVNKYELVLKYPLTPSTDPNYFEKIFSTVSTSRKIEFTYGDAAMSNFLYKNEQAIITSVKSNFDFEGSVCITYTVGAVSNGALGLSGGYTFPATYDQPSNVIRKLLKDMNYGLKELFPGMINNTIVESLGLIPGNDLKRNLDMKTNINVLDYLDYLVSMMSPDISTTSEKGSFYVLTFIDDTSGTVDGSYFKIVQVDSAISHPEAYEVDVGFPGSNYVFNLNVSNDENYSILYDYQKQLHPQEYVMRINADGEEEQVYAPTISSNNSSHDTGEDDKSWWNKITQYPIKASITIRGLLRPAILMNYVKLNIYIYGQKHINSGLYIITKQVDKIDGGGYRTVLDLTRIASEAM